MNFDHIFILTYGRSGSTFLQGVLNSIPGVLIRGENAGALHGLFHSWKAAEIASSKFAKGSQDETSPWYGAAMIDLDWYGRDLAMAFARNILRPTPDAYVLGFKEIRYGMPFEQLEDEVSFMRRFFRRSAFIVNTRDLDATIKSNERAGHAITAEEIAQSDRNLRRLADPDVFHVHYDDYRGTPANLKPMFDFLGADFSIDALANVMQREHSVITQR